MKPRVAVALLSGIIFAIAIGSPQASASVGACPTNYHYDFLQDYWSHSSGVAGFRAPIELRKDGDPCTVNSQSEFGAVYEWVGLQGPTGGISQIGWADYGWDPSTNPPSYCRFWYWDNGNGTTSQPGTWDRCGTDSVGTVRLFQVEETNINGTHKYSIFDCGTANWQNCSRIDDGPKSSQMASSEGLVATESPYGTGCEQVIMGSSANPVVFGGSLGDIKGIANFGDAYTTHNLTYGSPSCSHYQTGIHNDVKLSTYDNRN